MNIRFLCCSTKLEVKKGDEKGKDWYWCPTCKKWTEYWEEEEE